MPRLVVIQTRPIAPLGPGVGNHSSLAFSDVRKAVSEAAADSHFGLLFPVPRKSMLNSLIDLLMRMAA